jgi:hypothetical protein
LARAGNSHAFQSQLHHFIHNFTQEHYQQLDILQTLCSILSCQPAKSRDSGFYGRALSSARWNIESVLSTELLAKKHQELILMLTFVITIMNQTYIENPERKSLVLGIQK